MKTLITGEEIKTRCGLSANFPAIDLNGCKAVENHFFLKHLSLDIYKKLLDNVVDYSDVVEWNPATAYDVGDLVKRLNKVYKVTTAHTDKRPPNSYWEEAPRIFLDEQTSEATCINTIWCDGFLADCLAWAVLVAKLPFINKKIETDGVGTTVNDKFTPSSLPEFQVTQSAAKKMYEMCLENLKEFIETNKCFLPPSVETDCCDPCKKNNTVYYDSWLIA